jgi:pimeloyl-ACP methyl ester carboxylesterase
VRTEPVLLVHGFASSFERNWREPGWADLLAEAGRQVIGIDLLGHGKADKPHEPAAYANLEDSVAAALPEDGQVDAVGFSMGATLVLRVASRMPERFARIVVGGVGQNVFRSEDPDVIARAVEEGAADDDAPGMARAFIQFAAGEGNDAAALAACLRRPHEALVPADLAAVTCPVLVVLGDKDFAGPAEPLVEALPNATLLSLRGLDHFGTPKDFRFLDAALEFLEAVPG